jgi:hypothetical protein
LLASTGECTAEHIAAALTALLATKLCVIQITLHDIRGRLRLAASLSAGSVAIHKTRG